MERKLFPSQEENEAILLVIREHWAHLLLKVLAWIFFAALFVIFYRFASADLPMLLQGTWGQVTLLFSQLYLMLLALSLFLIFSFHYISIQVITSIRVVDVSQQGLFSHTISELHIDKIEDATSQTAGFWGTIFNYGDVFVQTAGSLERFDFHNIPNPAAIEKRILDLYEKNSNYAKSTGKGED